MTPCIRCGAPARETLHPLDAKACSPCHSEWLREESCGEEAVSKAIGAFGTTGRSYTQHEEAFQVELGNRTAAWAAKERA